MEYWPRWRRALSDENIETANPNRGQRFAIDGPGKPYIIFAILASAALVVAMVFVPPLIFYFGILSPIWAIGHVCIFAAGRRLNEGDPKYGWRGIRVGCVLIIVLMAAVSPVFYFFPQIGHYGAGNEWMRTFFIYGLPTYLIVIFLLFLSTFLLKNPRR